MAVSIFIRIDQILGNIFSATVFFIYGITGTNQSLFLFLVLFLLAQTGL